MKDKAEIGLFKLVDVTPSDSIGGFAVFITYTINVPRKDHFATSAWADFLSP